MGIGRPALRCSYGESHEGKAEQLSYTCHGGGESSRVQLKIGHVKMSRRMRKGNSDSQVIGNVRVGENLIRGVQHSIGLYEVQTCG